MNSKISQEKRDKNAVETEWSKDVHRPLRNLDVKKPMHWTLRDGIALHRDRGGIILEAKGRTWAVWKGSDIASGQVDFSCLIRKGIATISWRRSSAGSVLRAYALKIGNDQVSIVRQDQGREDILAQTDLRVDGKAWHDVTIALFGKRIVVWLDGLYISEAIDPDPLPRGFLTFGSEEGSDAAFADIIVWRRWSWADGYAKDIRKLLASRKADFSKFGHGVFEGALLTPPAPFLEMLIKFQKAVLAGHDQPTVRKVPAGISCGAIPPNFVHSWAIDLRDIPYFEFKWGEHEPRQSLDLDGGDRLYVVDSSNKLLKEFKPSDPDWTVGLKAPGGTPYDEWPYARIYLILESSSKERHRRLEVEGVIATVPFAHHTGGEEALLVADDLNYDPSLGRLFWGRAPNGTLLPIAAPWAGAESVHTYKDSFDPPAEPGDPVPGPGWYLLGKHIAEYPENYTGFFSLAYYNEEQSKLRLYLWNHSLPDATAYWVSVGMQRRIKNSFEKVEGALFKLDPRPTHWSSADVIIPAWPVTKWAFVEIPMLLYPMALRLIDAPFAPEKEPAECRTFTNKEVQNEIEAMGVATEDAEKLINTMQHCPENVRLTALVMFMLANGLLLDWELLARLMQLHKPECYHSVYEERFEPEASLCNFRITIEVKPVDQGSADLEFIGTGKGEAVQIGFDEALDLAELAADALEKGGDWYEKGEKVHDKILELIKEKKDEGASESSLKTLIALAGMGSSGWGAILASIGAWVEILKQVYGDQDEALRMAVELAIWGEVKGVITTEKQPRPHYIYLPGRFSFNAAFLHGQNHSREFDNVLPRYDRTLGLFGFRYDPTTVALPMAQHWYVHSTSPWVDCIFPCLPYTGDEPHDSAKNPMQQYLTRHISRWLPVIFNPYAEIEPVRPHLVAPDDSLAQAVSSFSFSFESFRPVPGKDPLAPEFAYPSIKDEKLFDHEHWFDWIQDMSAWRHITKDPKDQNFPAEKVHGVGSRMYVLCNSPVKTAKLNYSVFHISPLTGIGSELSPRWVGLDWGVPSPEERDVRNGVWLEVAPVHFQSGPTYFANVAPFVGRVVTELHDNQYYEFAEQTQISPGTYQAFSDIANVAVHHGWRFRFYGQVPNDGFSWNFDDETQPFPLQDILFHWDIRYFYYGRTRKAGNQVKLAEYTASFQIPVSISVLKFKSTWNTEKHELESEKKWQWAVYKSQMLQEPNTG